MCTILARKCSAADCITPPILGLELTRLINLFPKP